MFDIEKFLKPILELKRSAKNYGKLDFYEEGIKDIQSVIIDLDAKQKELSGDLLVAPKLCNELADSYGIQGGIYRRWGLSLTDPAAQKEKFRLSFESYDKGYETEKQGNKLVSYNLLNRLVSRVFFEPAWLTLATAGTDQQKFLHAGLHASLEIINSQRKEREDDIWFFADLGLNKILLKEEDPNKAFVEFIEKTPIDTDYASLFAVLRPLSNLPTEVQDHVKEAIVYIEDERKRRNEKNSAR